MRNRIGASDNRSRSSQPESVLAQLASRPLLLGSVQHLISTQQRRRFYAVVRQRPAALNAEERQRLLQMGADLEAAWHHPAATAATRKRIIRAVLREVMARVEDDQIQLLLHWQGGDHTRLTVRKNRRGQTRWTVEPETIDLWRQ
jgi:hypothetical protein